MGSSREVQVLEAEELLRKSMLESETVALGELLSSSLIFTNHLVQVFGKKEDLDAHQSGLLRMSNILVENQKVKLQRDTAVVFSQVTICGNYAGNPANGTFRFARVWQNTEGNRWEVIAVHSSLITV